MKNKVFVYGTLKAGFGNNILLKDSKLIEPEAYVVDWKMYSMFSNAFPVAVPISEGQAKTHLIKGEVYEIDNSTELKLDRLEGYPNFYQKTRVSYCNKDLYLIGYAKIYYIVNSEDGGFELSTMSKHCNVKDKKIIWDWTR